MNDIRYKDPPKNWNKQFVPILPQNTKYKKSLFNFKSVNIRLTQPGSFPWRHKMSNLRVYKKLKLICPQAWRFPNSSAGFVPR